MRNYPRPSDQLISEQFLRLSAGSAENGAVLPTNSANPEEDQGWEWVRDGDKQAEHPQRGGSGHVGGTVGSEPETVGAHRKGAEGCENVENFFLNFLEVQKAVKFFDFFIKEFF